MSMRKESDPDLKRSYLKLVSGCPDLFYQQYPHLGNKRFFVCLWGLIRPEEIPEHWGLIWVKKDRFYIKKYSDKFRSDLHTEKNLLMHALRRYASGDATGIIVDTY